MAGALQANLILSLILIGVAVFFDLKTRKVPNQLVLGVFALAVLASLVLQGLAVFPSLVVSMIAAFAMGLPLYLMKSMGAGDVKLLMAISPLFLWSDLIAIFFYSLVWGVVLGLLMIALKGESKVFARNLTSLALRNPLQTQQLHKMPFTIAIFFGVLTQASLAAKGVSLW